MLKITIAAAVTIMSLFCSTIAAQASEAVDMTRNDCAMTIEMKYDGKPVNGGTLTLYRVGDIVENSGMFNFKWKDELNCTVGMDNLATKETAAKVLECIKLKNLDGITVNVDDKGEAVFSNLEVGLYLVEQKTAAEGYMAISSFLISIPQWEDGHYVYSVTAAAKSEIHLTQPDTTPDSTSDNQEEKLPQTGQLNWPVPLLAVSGAAFLVAGLILRRTKNDA